MSKVKWLVQDVNIHHDVLHYIVDSLCEAGCEYGTVGIIPFSNEITGLEHIISPDYYHNNYAETECNKDDIYVFKGCNKIIQIIGDLCEENLNEVYPLIKNNYEDGSPEFIQQEKYRKNFIRKMKNSIFHDMEKFDQLFYSKLDLPLLNSNSTFLKMNESLDIFFDEDKFIKPSTDMKYFAGGIIPKGKTIKEFVTNQRYNSSYMDAMLMVANLVDIMAEYRIFVVDGEIITGSLYKLGTKVQTSNVVPKIVYEFVKKVMKIYEPHDIYAIDVAITHDIECKIVEYNGWNCSGAYACDLEKTFKAINHYMVGRVDNV